MHCDGQTLWIVDAHHRDGKRFVVRADEKLTAFVELESVIRASFFDRTTCVAGASNSPRKTCC